MNALVWLRDDLRLADNPALSAAVEFALGHGGTLSVLYLFDEQSPGLRPLGGAARWWLHHSLTALAGELESLGVTLVFRSGAARRVVPEVVAESGARAVFWNRRYAGVEREIDAELKAQFRDAGLAAESFAANLLYEPWTVKTGSGTPYGVFTPFWRACRALAEPREPVGVPAGLAQLGAEGRTAGVAGSTLASFALLPTAPDWSGGLAASWRPGEAGAHARLEAFIAGALDDYAEGRDFTDRSATSRLSAHLRWGELSPHQVWHAAMRVRAGRERQVDKFLAELGWREFAWHVLYHFPDLAQKNWRAGFDAFPWRPADHPFLAAWQRGQTGVDLVDAGMSELWQTGYMHNRVRMVVASFLTKNLLLDWRLGEAWFWDTLVDADAAANPFSWQWVAGSGADAAPYFRVFNPILQAEKFDPSGRYRARWLGDTPRPAPIVDLKESRDAALAAYAEVSAEKAQRAADYPG